MKLSFLRSSLCILHFFLSLKLLDFSFNFIQKLVSFENIVLVEALLDVLKVAGDIFERVKEVKLLGAQVEFAILNSEGYTIDNLWADVYMISCSIVPDSSKKFKAKVKLPWSVQYTTVNDNSELQQVFNMFKA
ncbi:hypothetical protein ACOSQ3_005056 [Xanthoceras sorbifolium]